MPPSYNSKPDAKVLASLLSARPLKRLIKGAKDQQILQQLIDDVIPKNIRDNITTCQIEYQQIILAVGSSSWATRLRAHQSDLLFGAERYYRALGKLTGVKIVIRQPAQEKPIPKKKELKPAKAPTKPAIELIQDAASSCEHEELKCALSRLAANMQVYSDKDSY
jgi:hypothetical protein